LWIGPQAPTEWPDGVDVAVALVCEPSPVVEASSLLEFGRDSPRLTFRLPLLRPLEQYVPPELDRFRKYLQPEPFRPLTVLAAVHELEAVAGCRQSASGSREASDDPGVDGSLPELVSFVEIAVAFLLREVLQGHVNLAPGSRVIQRGLELLRAQFSAACCSKFPEYRTLVTHHDWTDLLAAYRKALRSGSLSDLQRRGDAAVVGGKAELLRTLLGQKSAAAGDSFLRLLGPLVETSGNATAFSLRFTLHPGEKLALDYLRRTGRKRAVPLSAVQEVLRHAGYLAAEAETLVGILTDRGLAAAAGGGLRPLVEDRAEREQASQEIAALSARLTELLGAGEVPEAPQGESLRDLWSHLDRLRGLLGTALNSLTEQVEGQGDRLRELLPRRLSEN
jgi:hypothetical protein